MDMSAYLSKKTYRPPSIEDIESALRYIDPNMVRDDWAKIGMALKSELGDSGFDVFDSWSEGGSSYKSSDVKSTWNSINGGGGVGIATLFHFAKEAGWKPEKPNALMDEAARLKRQQQRQADNEKAETAKREKNETAAATAIDRWNVASEASPEHPYLVKKGIQPVGIKQEGKNLLIPVQDEHGQLMSLQAITPDGEKKFQKGGATSGMYMRLQGTSAQVVICEGYATAVSIHAATGANVAVAFSCHNMMPVAKKLRSKLPNADIVIAGDSLPEATAEKAREVAKAINARVALPSVDSDFNDMALAGGDIKSAIESAAIPAPDKPEGQFATVVRMSDVKPEPINWLWFGRIALGKVSMIAGDPGLGKSIITAAIAGHVTNGSPWPVDGADCPRGDVIMLSAEDDAADTIRPRLDAAGADVSRVYQLTMVKEIRDGEIDEHVFSLERDLLALDDLLTSLPDAKVVTIDPISAYLGGTDSHKNSDVRAALAPLATLASKHRVAIVTVTHLNKSGSGSAMYRASGSLAFVAAARAVFAVTKCKDDPARRLVLPIKNNIGNDQTGLAYGIATADNGAPVISWEPDPVVITADEALDSSSDDDRSEREEAADWLQDTLSGGPVETTELQKLAKQSGHSWSTVRRAKGVLGVESVKQGFSGKWVWQIPDTAPKVPTKPEDAQSEYMGTLGGGEHLGGCPRCDGAGCDWCSSKPEAVA